MDTPEDFEFKPLTEGLGFHRKKQEVTLKNETHFVAQEDKNFFTTPLPRNTTQQVSLKKTEIPEINPAIDDLLKNLNSKPTLDFLNSNKNKVQTPQVETKKSVTLNTNKNKNANTKIHQPALTPKAKEEISVAAAPSLAAGFLDSMLVVAFQLMCLIAMMVITQADLVQNILNPDPQYLIYASLATLFFGVAWIYYTLTRMFVGSTLGEWVYDLQMGKKSELFSNSYFLKISLRPVLTMLSGIVVLPIISQFLGYDILGRWMGLELIERESHG